jgi:hypothetical protein
VFLDFELLGPNWDYFKFCQIFYKLIQTNFKHKTNPFPSLGPNPAGPTWAGRGHSTQTPPRAPHLGTELNIVTALSRPRAVRPAAADPWTPPNVFTSCRRPLLSLSCGPATRSYPSPSSSRAVVPASPNTPPRVCAPPRATLSSWLTRTANTLFHPPSRIAQPRS